MSRRFVNKVVLVPIILLSFLHANRKLSHAHDTLNATRTIRDSETLVSARGVFELGFFNPSSNSSNWYLGIWYKNITVKTVIWVANREAPLKSISSGVLRVTPLGQLIILNSTTDNNSIWSSNSSRIARDEPVLQLLDTGNLVLRHAADDRPENYLWQSFDHPTDTFLPGMDLGLDDVYLTSWRNAEDPAPGDYVMHLTQKGYPQVFIRKANENIYRVGPWNGLFFSGTPYASNPAFTFGVYRSREGVFYFREDEFDESIISRVTLSPNGFSVRWRWVDHARAWVAQLAVPVDNCDAYNSCGAYGICVVGGFPLCKCLNKFEPQDPKRWAEGDWASNGCVRRRPLNCTTGDAFIKYSNLKLPDALNSWYNESMTLAECRAECLRNCSCTAYTTLNISGRGSGCLIWFGNLIDIRTLSIDGQDLYIRMASSELGSTETTRTKLIVCLTLVGMVLLVLSIVLYFRKTKKNGIAGRYDKTHGKDLEQLALFDLSTILKATKSFSFQNKIGEGGFGPVYKGTLEDGQEIAVKRLSETSKQGRDEFKNEIIFVAKLQHRNLVKLLGCCIQEEETMLIYEYMSNKSLDTVLFDQTNKVSLDWSKRFQIVNGIARGVVYLHQDSRLRIIHRDLKASNILLDSEMNPKISDFGIAKRYQENVIEDKTNRVIGTYGYMSPEYAICGRFSEKSDVFSFGVIVLEIVSGKRNSSYIHGDRHLSLLGLAWTLHMDGKSLDLVDKCLQNLDNLDEKRRLIQVGLLCVQQHPRDRPSMTSVVAMLNNECELPQPNRPGFFMDACALANVSSNSTCSTNQLTITMLAGR